MKNKLIIMLKQIGSVGFVALAFLILQSCNVTPDINQVNKSNYSEKKLFDGEWLISSQVVDKPINNATIFVGTQCGVDRGRFEITEDKLLVYRAYEKVRGTEGKNYGEQTLIAAFPIVKHFDIRRKYNDVNGVENNVIAENDVDRPWQDRDNIRVDWSNNLVSDSECNEWIKTNTSLQLPSSNNQMRDPYRVRIGKDYMETTINAFAKPNASVCSYIGDWNCVGSQVKIKFSFLKVKPSDFETGSYPDYLPLEYGKNKNKELCAKGEKDCANVKALWLSQTSAGTEICDPSRHNIDDCKEYQIPVFSRFGYFRTERFYYDREKDFTLSGREQLINRWNIWQQSKAADGSVIPLSERIPKPIIYYLNVEFPPELYDASQTIANEWNVAFSQTVSALKNQCSISSYNNYVTQNKLKLEMSSLGFKVVTEANIKEACYELGKLSANKKLQPIFYSGDYRQINDLYGQMFQIKSNDCNIKHVNEYAAENNITKSLVDNGIAEVTIGNLEEACAVLEKVSLDNNFSKPFSWQQLGDLRYSFLNYTPKAELAGPLGYGPSSADPLTGEIFNANANIYGASIDIYASRGADIVDALNGKFSANEILNGTMLRKELNVKARASNSDQILQRDVAEFEKVFAKRTNNLSDKDYHVKLPFSTVSENWKILENSGFEEQYLISDEMIRLFADGSSGSSLLGFSKAEVNRAKPSNWAGMQFASSKESSSSSSAFLNRVDFFGRRNACFLAETVEPAIADLAAKLKGKSREEAYQIIRANIFIAVALHEIGHTLGLRHNFEGSADALNFFPEFWKVNGDATSKNNLSKINSEIRYSSIMDYHQRFNSDFGGIGLYDKAAIKFGYGGLIEVFDQSNGNFVPPNWHENFGMFNYKDLPLLYSGEDADEKITAHYNQVLARFKGGDKSARINIHNLGIEPDPENLFRRKDVSFDQYSKSIIHRLFSTGAKKELFFEVPFKFCSDAHASGANLTCNRWDMGASAEEIVDNAAEMYESYYLFDSFRRDRINFSPSSYMAKLYQRTYRPMIAPFSNYYAYHRSSMLMWPLMQDWATASYKGLNFFGKVLQSVDPGHYCLENNMYVLAETVSNCENGIDIGLEQGRYYDTHFSPNFFSKPDNVGHMYDKLLAMQALTDSSTFLKRDFSVAVSRESRSIGYYRVFAPEMIQLFSGILNDDIASYSPEIIFSDNAPMVKYRQIVGENINQTTDILPRIKASNSWILRYYALVFPMVNFTSNVDKQLDFAKRARITLVGSKHDPVVDTAINQIIFTDPLTKIQYRSLAPEGEALAPGFKLLKAAQTFINDGTDGSAVGEWFQAQLDLKKAKELKNQATLSNDKVKLQNAKILQDDAETKMHRMDSKLLQQVQIIDMVRYLGDLFDYGG